MQLPIAAYSLQNDQKGDIGPGKRLRMPNRTSWRSWFGRHKNRHLQYGPLHDHHGNLRELRQNDLEGLQRMGLRPIADLSPGLNVAAECTPEGWQDFIAGQKAGQKELPGLRPALYVSANAVVKPGLIHVQAFWCVTQAQALLLACGIQIGTYCKVKAVLHWTAIPACQLEPARWSCRLFALPA